MVSYRKFFAIISALLCTSVFAGSGTQEAINKFFAQMKETRAEHGTPVLKDIECRFISQINFSEQTHVQLNPIAKAIFEKPLPAVFKNNGTLKASFESDGNNVKVKNLYLYTLSTLGSFTLSKVGDRIEIMLPHMGMLVEDSLEEIKKSLPIEQASKSLIGSTDTSQLALLTNLFDFIIDNEQAIKEKIKFDRRSNVKGHATHIYRYPAEEALIEIEIFDGLWTLASLSFQGHDREKIILNYRPPSDEITPMAYYPESMHITGAKRDNSISMELSNIVYNTNLRDRDFKTTKTNLRVLMTTFYIKALQQN